MLHDRQVAVVTAWFGIVNGIRTQGYVVIEPGFGESLFALAIKSYAVHVILDHGLFAATVDYAFVGINIAEETNYVEIAW